MFGETVRRSVPFLIALIMIAGLSLYAIAVPEDAQGNVGQTGAYTAPTANAVGAEGGNVSYVNVTSDQSTQKWQGFVGNISGSLQLGDGSSTFFDWSGVTFGAVFASPGSTVDWGTATDLNTSAELQGKDTEYGFTSSDPDSINSTMSGTSCDAGTVFSFAAGVTPYNSSGQPSVWTTCIGEDGGAALDDTIFGTNVSNSGSVSYNGSTMQYQLMVPVQAAGDSYYFYLEI